MSALNLLTVAAKAFGATVLVFAAFPPALSLSRVEGRSMQPSLNPVPARQEFVLGLAKEYLSVTRGSVVLMRDPFNKKKTLIKRIVGLPGDVVWKDGNDILLVPPGQCWVEGDNSSHSFDSRSFGPVPMNLIKGSALFVVFPFTAARRVAHLRRPIVYSQQQKPLPVKMR